MRNISDYKIALVGPLPPPSGGMANQTQQLAELLQRDGIVVEVIRTNSPYRPSWVGRLRVLRALFRFVPYVLTLWRAAKRADLFHVMANSGWSWHLFAAPAVWIAWLRCKPALVNYRGGEAEAFFAKSWRWVRPTLRRACTVIVPSTFLEAVFTRRGISVSIVPNIVDLNRFTPRKKRVGGKLPLETWPHIIVTRNLEPIYDIATALRAFASIRAIYPAAHLSIAGSGPDRDSLESLARELRISSAITFTGYLDNTEIAALYQTADLMLNPSLADNMPVSVLESLASGVPVVSTDAGGVPHVIEHGVTALLVPPGKPTLMAESARILIEDQGLARRLSRAGVTHVRQFEWKQVRSRLFRTYGETITDSTKRHIVHSSGR